MDSTEALKFGGVVLCGGQSKRMGKPKWSLPFGDELMLSRIIRILSPVLHPIVVVAAEDQQLSDLPGGVLVSRDKWKAKGPLAGLYSGLMALHSHCDAAFVTACDVPLLKPELVRHLLSLLKAHEIAIPFDGEYYHPLTAVYRPYLHGRIRELISRDQLRPLHLVEDSDSLRIPMEELRIVDPNLDSFQNLNHPEDYRAALVRAGLKQHAD